MIRTIEDRLHEEYFDLLPDMARTAHQLQTKIEYHLLPIFGQLKKHENLTVKARVKECASAIEKLKKYDPEDSNGKRSPGSVFDRDRPELYTLLSLRDLIGVRVLAFPSSRAVEVDSLLRSQFKGWKDDYIFDDIHRLAFKYHGTVQEREKIFGCEYQIVSSLIGFFWEVEHSAFYKLDPAYKGLMPVMKDQTSAVHKALIEFEQAFEKQLEEAENSRD